MATPSSVTTWVLLFIVLGYGESKYNGSNDAGGTVDRIQQQSLGSMLTVNGVGCKVANVVGVEDTRSLLAPESPHQNHSALFRKQVLQG
jgi:hypothetical protein